MRGMGIYGVPHGNDPDAYMLDVLYTQDDMDTCENDLVQRLIDFDVEEYLCESNFAGRAWNKVLEALYKKKGSTKCKFLTFDQKKNKEAKILATASTVTRKVIMPAHWKSRWGKFHTDVTEFQRSGKNKNDDAQDMLSEVAFKRP